MNFGIQTECPFCGSPGAVCENTYCIGPSSGAVVIALNVPKTDTAKFIGIETQREILLTKQRELESRRDEIKRLTDTWKFNKGFRRGCKEFSTLVSNDKKIVQQMTAVSAELGVLNSMRKVMNEGRNHG